MKIIIKQLKSVKACTMAALVLCCAASSAYAQPTLQLPVNPDSVWYNSTGGGNKVIQGINTAMINYGSGSPAPGQLYACTFYDGTDSSYIYVIDLAQSPIAPTIIPGYNTIAGVPDLIIGNDTTASTINTKYIAAAAYVNDTNGHIEIDYYRVNDDPSFSMFNIAPEPTSPTTIIAGYAPHTVHIDVLANRAAPGINGRPVCSPFVVTWDDYSSATPKVYAALGDLNTRVVGTPQLVDNGSTPDVAVIERFNGVFLNVDTIALLTYLDAGGNTLYYNEWDFSTMAGAGATTLDYISGANPTIAKPRIAADPNPAENGTATNANWKVVAQIDTPAGGILSPHYQAVRSYDNVLLTYTPPYFTSSDVISLAGVPVYSAYTAPFNDYAPTVALGTQYDYQIMHYMNYGVNDSDVVMMEPIGWNAPTTVGDYWWVNSSGSPLHAVPAYQTYATSVSDPANMVEADAPFTIFAWAFYNSSTNKYEVDYKIPTAYNFRPGATSAVTNVQANEWELYPNPAAGVLNINNNGAATAAGGYRILDMTGRELLHGSLSNSISSIDVSGLAAGTYGIMLYEQGEMYGEKLFVKLEP